MMFFRPNYSLLSPIVIPWEPKWKLRTWGFARKLGVSTGIIIKDLPDQSTWDFDDMAELVPIAGFTNYQNGCMSDINDCGYMKFGESFGQFMHEGEGPLIFYLEDDEYWDSESGKSSPLFVVRPLAEGIVGGFVTVFKYGVADANGPLGAGDMKSQWPWGVVGS